MMKKTFVCYIYQNLLPYKFYGNIRNKIVETYCTAVGVNIESTGNCMWVGEGGREGSRSGILSPI
jgi:hypothetical protein